MAAVQNAAPGMVDPAIFEQLQANIDEDTRVREELRNILQKLERQGRVSQSLLARAHSTPAAELEAALSPAWPSIVNQAESIQELASVASKQNYYRYNGVWTGEVRNTILAVVFCVWLGAGGKPRGSLPTINEVGSSLGGKLA
ncbi:MAG: hypothetical protein L6R41_001619 [Letrouitia leprolyta]|nr:MAG: hypothetical protein L6R41_001619 [Letrouitia leprolyta]